MKLIEWESLSDLKGIESNWWERGRTEWEKGWKEWEGKLIRWGIEWDLMEIG